MSLDEAIRWVVQVAVARERRLLELDADFYRDHNRQFALGRRVGHPLVQGIRGLLESKRDQLRIENVDYAAFLLARGLGGILRVAVDERPELMTDDAFIDELEDLFRSYLTRSGD
jgi:hypothetical protein